MSLVTPVHWEFWMGDKPMPEGCTREMMFAMYDAIKKIEDRDYALEQVKFYEGLFREWLPRYKTYEGIFSDPEKLTPNTISDYGKTWENIQESMKLLKEQILYWRGEFLE